MARKAAHDDDSAWEAVNEGTSVNGVSAMDKGVSGCEAELANTNATEAAETAAEVAETAAKAAVTTPHHLPHWGACDRYAETPPRAPPLQ
jgi:hypothetical protein